MARDYKHRAQPRRRKPPVSGRVWFLAGLLVGAFGTGLLWLKSGSLEEGERWIGARPEPESPPTASDRAVKPPKPKFDFYNLLPEMEVIVPDDELDPVDAAPAAPRPNGPAPGDKPPAAAASGRYLVQVASFRRAADAERLKAELALLGFEAHVQRGRGSDGTWHRVRTGPFAGVAEVKKAQSQLAEHGMKGYVVRLSGP